MFTQSAYINKYSDNIVNWLYKLGYTDSEFKYPKDINSVGIATANNLSEFSIINKSLFESTNPHITWNCNGRIGCFDNEPLFLGLSALRNDTAKYQFFMTDITDSKKIDIIGEAGNIWIWYDDNEPEMGNMLDEGYYHKMTVDELIKYQNKLPNYKTL